MASQAGGGSSGSGRGALVFSLTDNCPEVKAMFAQVAARLQDLRPVFQDFQGRMQRSIGLNFQRGGRPDPWPPSKRALNRGRGAGKTGQTLRQRGILLNSVTGPGAYTAGTDFLEIATNVPYAKTHQYGAEKGSFGTVTARVRTHSVKPFLRKGKPVKGHERKEHPRKQKVPWGDIPKRRFLMVQASDTAYLKRSIARYVFSGSGSSQSQITGGMI
ncbi:MAG: phage virion morphogenesis protein [bacterium]